MRIKTSFLLVIFSILFSFDLQAAEIISPSSEWRYFDKGVIDDNQWFNSDFNDTHWPVGKGQFGYGEGDESTITSFGNDLNNKPLTQYFRRKFELVDLNGLDEVNMRLLVDDGAIVYLNGKEIYRVNVPEGVSFPKRAVNSLIEHVWIQVPLQASLFNNKENTIAVAVYQLSAKSTDLSFDLALISGEK